MQIFSLKNNIPNIPHGAVWVLGFFDGVHLGHKKLFEEAENIAKQLGGKFPLPISVWSFSSLPKANELLTTREETAELLGKCGADYLVLADFNDVSQLDGETFFTEQLQIPFAPAAIVCGFNFRFGYGAKWAGKHLAEMGNNAGIPVHIVDAYTAPDGEIISSTRIRTLIQSGEVEKANTLLLSPYTVTAVVQHGKRLGRTIGFPTINQRMPDGKVLPAYGIYLCRVSFTNAKGERYSLPGVCNIGFRPTVNSDTHDITLETYILHYQGDLYGHNVLLSFYKKLRDEQKFPNIEALSQQIAADAAAAEAYFSNMEGEEKCL